MNSDLQVQVGPVVSLCDTEFLYYFNYLNLKAIMDHGTDTSLKQLTEYFQKNIRQINLVKDSFQVLMTQRI